MGTDRKVRLVAVDSQKYGSRQLRPGDTFTVPESDAEDIMALGIGKLKDVEATQTKVLTAEPPKKRKYVKSGKYKRRDMRAES